MYVRLEVLLEKVSLLPALLSLALNFLWRGRDLQHTATVLAACLAARHLLLAVHLPDYMRL